MIPIFIKWCSIAISISCLTTLAFARVPDEDKKLIDEASCEEIIKEHKNYSAAEKKLKSEIASTSKGTVATNVVGVATMAVFGLGFFTWNDQADAKENLAELTAYREAIEASGNQKRCALEVEKP